MKYPAKSHAQRIVTNYNDLKTDADKVDAIYVAGEMARLWPDSDIGVPFRQGRYFLYVTGCSEPDCHVLYHVGSMKLTLYLPPIDEDSVMWSGLPKSPEEALEEYDVDEVKYSTELSNDLTTLKTVAGIQKSAQFPSVVEDAILKQAFDEARMIKDEHEIKLLREAQKITHNCHMAVMSALPIETNERHIHAEFMYHSIRQGCKTPAYDPICCSGTNAGTLHYVKNDEDMENRLLVLIDAGAEYESYSSDVTRTWPINGHWTTEARQVYDIVAKMQEETMKRIRPGIQWEDLHMLAHRILIDEFLKLGLFQGGTAEEIFQSGISGAFYPHGLGHMMGLEVHDTGGRPNYEDPDPLLRYLRIRRKLEAGMVVTVEPGCYFNDFLLAPHVKSHDYINWSLLEKYKPVGGVRIEDDVLVTPTGFENLTTVPSDAEAVAKIVRDGISKGRKHFHNLV